MAAKIKPTSPRGIIPMPTLSRSTPRPRTPREQTCLESTAARVRPAASNKTLESRKLSQIDLKSHHDEEDGHEQRGDR